MLKSQEKDVEELIKGLKANKKWQSTSPTLAQDPS
jgi:hypothetical protein